MPEPSVRFLGVSKSFGRAEVLRGNATFGIFGDGKEVAQLAMAKVFRPGVHVYYST